jgi:Asp-tRNA(Asn)/Glu-tRNA(Gln) amidotransferase A subunit family amidase
MRTWKIVGLAALLASSAASAAGISVEEITVSQLQKAITDKRASCREIVEAHLERIASFDKKGPALNAILTLNPRALARADELDAAFATSGLTGPLHCVPVVLKDNYNTADLPTTDGSASLAGMQPTKDAFVVAKLRQAGAVVLAKAGATVIEIDAPDLDAAKVGSSTDVQKYEFKPLLNAYLASIPNAPAKSLADIIASGKIHKASVESFLKGSEAVENGMQEPDYKARLQRIADTRKAVDRVFDENRLDALVYPLQRRLVVPVTELNQADRNGILASVTGLPALDIPVGFSAPTADAPVGVPIGMDLLGRAWSEAALLRIGYAFEQAAHVRKPPPSTPALSH